MSRWLVHAQSLARRRPRETGAASAGALLAVALVVVAAARWPSAPPRPTAAVAEADFEQTLVEAGTIDSAHLMLYGSTLPGGPAKIAELVPEGRAVAAGDVLIRFDATKFEQDLAKERAALAQAEADLRGEREGLRLERLKADADVTGARQAIGYAESDLADATNGAGKLALAEATTAAGEAAREVARTQRDLDDLKPLLAEGFITQAELERAEQALARAREQQRLADLKRDTLTRYGRPAALARAKAGVEDARAALAREQEGADARIAQRQAALARASARADEIRSRIAILEDRLSRVTVRAAGPGLVVYRDVFFGSDRRKPQVGDEVWPNQPVVALPDSSQLIVDTRVREIDLHEVSASQRVFVRVDAYPDLRLRAAVELVGALAEADLTRAGTKFFPVTIRLVDTDPRLRTGMTARVEIEVASIPRATVVPSQAVFGAGAGRYCYVLDGRRPVRRPVSLAGDDGVRAAVKDGLRPGERVLLVEPEAGR